MPSAEPVRNRAPSLVRADVGGWVDYVNILDAMPAKDLKAECERLRRSSDRSWDDELRMALASSMQWQKAHNYQKAAETLSQVSSKIPSNSETRNWIKFYGQQVAVLAQLDKELAEEKRQRSELEKKLKALSDIERDISERSKTTDIARP